MPLLPIFSLFHLAAGVTSVFAEVHPAQPLALDPARLVRVINDLQIEYSFGSPTLWSKISEYCVRAGERLPSLKRVFMAGAPVPPRVLERVRGLSDQGEAFTPYGATEALPVTMISGASILTHQPLAAEGQEIGTLVGKAVSGVELCVIRSVDGVIESAEHMQRLGARQIGEIVVKGKNVSHAYLNRPDATRASKIIDGAEFWHRMGDLGYLDDEGNLYFCGRKSHSVQTAERTYYSDPVELIFNRHTKVRRSALVSYRGKEAAVVVEPFPQFWPETPQAEAEFRSELKTLGQSSVVTAGIQRFFFHRSFPVDARHNAKIFREQLSAWASKL